MRPSAVPNAALPDERPRCPCAGAPAPRFRPPRGRASRACLQALRSSCRFPLSAVLLVSNCYTFMATFCPSTLTLLYLCNYLTLFLEWCMNRWINLKVHLEKKKVKKLSVLLLYYLCWFSRDSFLTWTFLYA